MDKNQLREKYRDLRSSLNPAEQRRAAEDLAKKVSGLRSFRVSKNIAVYLASDGEIDTWPVIERIWKLGKNCYLPIVTHFFWQRLWFVPFEPESKLSINQFGILEPEVLRRERRSAMDMDLVLAPLVAFDKTGRRLGMGGGFYDHSLSFLNHRQHWRHPHFVGLAYETQQAKQLPANEWDVPLSTVVTEKSIYSF